MIKKILIANRGEIALRVIRTCRDMQIISVAVYSTADEDAMHTCLADKSICIGGPRARDSYLNKNNILQAACSLGVDAIHPGYGFLSEDYEFVKMCEDCGIKLIGPSSAAIKLLGDKVMARMTAKKANCPVVPGSDNPLKDLDEAVELADSIGYPVMLKAVSGGGGRGIRKIDNKEDLIKNFPVARQEAQECFGDDRVYMEKCILNPRHIEVQILADNFGNVVHLFERDCSMQRRHQKVIEECPAIKIPEMVKRKMWSAAVRVAKQAGYTNAGTVEFLLDEKNQFYFMEMNTRIQVEHTITEKITGVDIVQEQIKIANGEKLSFRQNELLKNGHAIEFRINAEDVERGFIPVPGEVRALNFPGGIGVRLDTAVYQECSISPFYDSMIAKLIVHGQTREEAIARARRALSEFIIEGVPTNIEYLKRILNNKEYLEGGCNIDFMTTHEL